MRSGLLFTGPASREGLSLRSSNVNCSMRRSVVDQSECVPCIRLRSRLSASTLKRLSWFVSVVYAIVANSRAPSTVCTFALRHSFSAFPAESTATPASPTPAKASTGTDGRWHQECHE
jgi:hypothetical protein